MIVQFPAFYPDELVYSVLARYYVQSGYIRYTFVAEDLFLSKTERPDMEFVNSYTQEAVKTLTKWMPMEYVIEKHTLFPYYGRFLQKERRQKAFQSLVGLQGDYRNLMPIPKSRTGQKRYLRYCPACASEDRERYGCTYWHRVHQLPGVSVCPAHGIYLVDSCVAISGNKTPGLVAAETAVPMNGIEACACSCELEKELARYEADIFWSKMDLDGNVTVGNFLHSRLEGTPYRSRRGAQRNIGLLHKDFLSYYKDIGTGGFTELWQIQKVLTDDRVNFHEICMLAFFLKVPVHDLVKMELPDRTQEQRFDDAIFQLREKGWKYTEIAKKLDASYDTVKAIGERKYRAQADSWKTKAKSGKKVIDWKSVDEEMLPLVKEAIKKLQGDVGQRPRKVTVYAVERLLELPSKRISRYLRYQKFNKTKSGRKLPYMMPSKKAMQRVKDAIRVITCRKSAYEGLEQKVAKLNPLIRGWRNYFQHGNSVKRFKQLDDYVWMKLWRRVYCRRKQKKYREHVLYGFRKWYASSGIEYFYYLNKKRYETVF